MKEVVKEVNVNVREDCLVWLVNTPDGEYAKNVDINVGAGCYVTMYINGRKYKPFATGSHEFEWRAYEKNSGKITLVGANVNGRFRLPFGLGGLEFTAADGEKSRIGVNGELTVKLKYDRASDTRYAYGDRAYNAFGCAASVTAADIRQKWIKTIRDAVRDAVVSKLAAYKTTDELRAAFDTAVKPAIEKALRKAGESMSADGIEIDGCHISDLFVDNRAADKSEFFARSETVEVFEPTPPPQAEEPPEADEPTAQPEEREEETASEEREEETVTPEQEETGEESEEHSVEEVEEPTAEEPEEENELEQAAAEPSTPEAQTEKSDDGMRECPGCRKPVASDARFCKYCGFRLKI